MDDPHAPANILAEAIRLQQSGDLEAAEGRYHLLLGQDPDHAQAWHYLGLIAYQRGEYARAVELIRDAIRRHGSEATFHCNLGLALTALGRHEDAALSFTAAIGFQPTLAAAHFNLGNVLCAQRKLHASIDCYREALRLEPGYGDARWNLSQALLLDGNFRDGLPAFEARRSADGLSERELEDRLPGNATLLRQRTYAKPRWNGEDLRGKTILLHFEYGFGDTIQFARYVPLLAARGARVLLEIQEPLADLLAGLEGLDEAIIAGDELPAYDYHCPLMSLPLLFETTLASIPAHIPYLRADQALVEVWRRHLAPRGAFRVGVVWCGNPYHFNDRNRSIALAKFAALAPLAGVSFHGLLKPDRNLTPPPSPPQGLDWTDLGAKIGDFSDLAAILANLDLLISVDTSVAHLGGALGMPVWLMLPDLPDWRWMLEREDSPWYPSMRLFRQPHAGDWDSVVARLRRELQGQVAR